MKLSALESSELTTREFAAQCRDTLIPLPRSMAYFSVLPLEEKENQRLIQDPVGAFPPRIAEIVPKLRLILVPYLQANPKDSDSDSNLRILFERPADGARRFIAFEKRRGEDYLFIAIREEEFYDSHILLYRGLARLVVERDEGLLTPFDALVDAEINAKAHGEIDEAAWRLKNEIAKVGSEAPAWGAYVLQALEDTLTLYLHGLCCDIDLEAGPKQLASKHIRKRLLLLKEHLPPPEGIALFPEEL